MRRKARSLQDKLTIFLVASIAVLIAVFVAVLVLQTRQNRRENEQLVGMYAGRLEDAYNADLADIINTAITLSYNDLVIDGFRQQADEQLADVGRTQLQAMLELAFRQKSMTDLVFFDTEEQPFLCRPGKDPGVYAALCPAELFGDKPVSGSFFVPLVHGLATASLSGPSFLYAIDVFAVNTTGGPRIKLGTLVAACMFSAYSDIGDAGLAVTIHDEGRVYLSDPRGLRKTDASQVLYRTLRYTGWSMDISYALANSFAGNGLPQITLLLVFIVLVMVLGVCFIVDRTIHTPLKLLLTELSAPGVPEVTVSSGAEIGRVSEHINNMLARQRMLSAESRQHTQHALELELGHRRAQLSALRAQINPHFLYNTLECIRSIAVAHGITPITEIAVAMGNIFRYAIKGEERVSVAEEIDIISDYERIISIRYMDRYRIHYQIDDRLWTCLIPRMMLQPIVENAVSHGLVAMPDGNVWITGDIEGSDIVFTIANDGAPIDAGNLRTLRAHLKATDAQIATEKIGLINIVQRIRLTYGRTYGVQIESSQDEGTQVTIRIPYKDSIK